MTASANLTKTTSTLREKIFLSQVTLQSLFSVSDLKLKSCHPNKPSGAFGGFVDSLVTMAPRGFSST